jgi:photosystem II stability/assembly factor-like uncharacterized protein
MSRRPLTLILGLLLVAAVSARDGVAQSGSPTPLSLPHLTWRQIGPASYGGRIDDIEAVPGMSIVFVATASGGLFKSVNNGVTWKAVFDEEGVSQSIGDVAIAPSDPNVVWIGTGEPNSRQSSSWGDGVYRSLDGGETWTYAGLKESHHIGRVVIHPRNPDVVFVAAMGHLWGPNAERGLYRTRDAGKTWEKVLGIDNDTGVVDVAIDRDGRTLFAAAYQRRRRAWGFVGGGPGSALYRSLDGGATWHKLAGGLPSGNVGRIGVEISKSHPDIVYAIVEHKTAGGVYRSEDRGATWTRQNALNPRPMYYGQIRIDPQNPHKVWVLGGVHMSLDGGKTFRSEGLSDRVHTDHHALWIDPQNPDHLLLGNDGGVYFSYDGARNWDFIDNLPIGQYYDIDIDTRDPYWVYGGTQDNGTWAIPSRTTSLLGITNADVVNIAYGDGFYTAIDPRDPRTIYANSQSGRTYLVDLDTREEKGIRPVPPDPKEEYRFNWSTPMLISSHDASVVFYGGNKVFRTRDRGHRWEVISPDLTRNQEWKKLPLMGERNDDTLSRDDGVSDYGTITTISESPRQAGVIYVGTDDGLVHVTRDAGRTWQNVIEKFKLPGPRWVSRVLASHHQPGTALVAFDGHQDDDFKPYIFRTTDFGATWTSVAGDLADGMVVNALAEHPRNPNLLFAGTEFGLFVTVNAGRSWTLLRGTLPRVPVDDIVISPRENDLVLGTHGRSIIILDDISLLEKTDPSVLTSDAVLFPIRPATQYYEMRALPSPGAGEFTGPNPSYGALITYYLKSDPPKPPAPTTTTATNGNGQSSSPATAPPVVKIQVLDAAGAVIRTLDGPDRAGFNRVAWDLRHPLTFTPTSGEETWFGPPKGTFVLPGAYTVKLSARGRELTETVEVRIDPRARTTSEALRARFDASQRVAELERAFFDGVRVISTLDQELQRITKALKESGTRQPALENRVKEATKQVDGLKEQFKSGWGGPQFQLLDLAGQLQASTTAPTEAQLRAIEHLRVKVTDGIGKVNAMLAGEMRQLEDAARAAGLGPLSVKPATPPSP